MVLKVTMQGTVILLEANRPTVTTEVGEQYLCYMRGRVKRDVGRIMVGDQVLFEPTDNGEAVITQILPRSLELKRPPVANVTGLFACFTLNDPSGNLELLDKRLVMAEIAAIKVEIILTKVDLVTDLQKVDHFVELYRSIGYSVWPLSAVAGIGMHEWLVTPRTGIWVLTGESGVGKSALISAVIPEARIATGELSRIGRGQQTTRWVKLLPIQKFWLADTPGYTALELSGADPHRIAAAFLEWSTVQCRFPNCLHGNEPGCQVKEGIELGRFSQTRYRHYRLMLEQWTRRWN